MKKLMKKIDIFFNLLITKIVLSKRLRKRADKYFSKTLKEFKRRKHRKPNRDEIFLLVVKASHRARGVNRDKNEVQGHFKRQWIRKYLLLKNNIRDRYDIQGERRRKRNLLK